MRALVASMIGDHPARPCLVLANTPAAGGIDWAGDQGLPTAVVDHRPFGKDRADFEHALQQALTAHTPDVLCLAGFMRILSADFVTSWNGRILNIHPSLLPKYRGLDTHARVLDAGDDTHGCTVHLVTPRLDDGPILGQARVPVLAGDTPETLAARVLEQEHRLYPAVLRRFVEGADTPLLM